MADDKIKELMRIPKRSTLKHYIDLCCELYGEPKESAEEYAKEQVIANEHQLDKAIECFKELSAGQDESKKEQPRKVELTIVPSKK